MIDTKLRGKFQPTFDIMAVKLVKIQLRPNVITWIAFGVGILASVSVAIEWMIPSILLLWLSGLLDVLDGTVARLTRSSSRGGAYMDLILDRMVEAAYILGLAYRFPQGYYAYLLFYVAVIFNFTTFIVAGALFQNNGAKSMHYDVGIAERTETFLVFTLLALFPTNIYLILMIFNAVIFITGMVRFKRVLAYSKSLD
ncbi:MAG: CDP-alcohol phosphatidyltransferase [Anaerosolibacter sp.]|jgi:phosphatidylglycerophosphate synthase|uniref:CDP-alcohol phosphatidyltransferase family protein n=1 Tax=Anaerosolibacter sp. TaxID=1872527 RepID=UPI00262C6F3A|nr:CDP-alcohol phosphatidyltransferase family protein [Anaerosolibacter sp.]MDF2548521.1 CDP-alcohol phosphatidyltransferase [Anaerosolibacter sp.]